MYLFYITIIITFNQPFKKDQKHFLRRYGNNNYKFRVNALLCAVIYNIVGCSHQLYYASMLTIVLNQSE